MQAVTPSGGGRVAPVFFGVWSLLLCVGKTASRLPLRRLAGRLGVSTEVLNKPRIMGVL